MTRAIARETRRALGAWQRAALGMLFLALVGNAILLGTAGAARREAVQWQTRCEAARANQAEAMAAYGQLVEQVEQERADREARAAAYTALAGSQYVGECEITYYCCETYPHICGTGDGLTATGLPVGPGIAAVDPAVIPLGATILVNGERYLAADVGGAVRGNHIDIAVPTHREALELGTGAAEVWIIDGGKANG